MTEGGRETSGLPGRPEKPAALVPLEARGTELVGYEDMQGPCLCSWLLSGPEIHPQIS